jgi:phage-related minor tail protein
MALNVGDLFATLRLDSAAYEQSIQEMNQLTSALGPTIATAFVAAGAAAAAGLGMVVMAADDMNRAVNGLQASTGATDAEMQGLESSLKNIYNANYGQSFDEVGAALAKARQETKLSGEALENFTTNAFAFADTFGGDVNSAVEGANQLMKDFNITQEEAWNLMSQGAQKGMNKNGEMIDTLREYSPQFKALGFGAEDMFNKIISGSEAGGWSIDKVADSVKEFNIRSKDGSKTSAEAFALMGMNAEEMTAIFAKGGPEAAAAFDQVVNTISSMEDPVARNAAAVGLFGAQFEDLEMEAFKSLSSTTKHVDATKKSMEKIKQVKYNSVGEAFKGIWRNIQTGLIDKINTNLMPLLNDMVAWFTVNMPTIQAVVQTAFDAVVAVMSPVIKAIGFFIENLDILGPAIIAMAGYILFLQVPAMWAWAAAAWAVASANLIAFAPVIAIMVAIGAAVALLAWIWKKWGDDIKKWVGDACSAVIQWFVDLWNKTVEIFDIIVEFFKEWGLIILMVITGPIGLIVGLIVSQWSWIKEFLNIMGQMIVALMRVAWNAIWNIIGPTVTKIVGWISAKWNWIKGVTSAIWNNIKNIASSVWNGISSTASSIWNGIASRASSIWGRVKEAITKPIEAAKNKIKDMLDKIKGFFGNLKLKIPKPKLPKVSVSKGSKSIGGIDVPYPKFNLSWYAKGGIATGPSVVGIGEAGDEAIVPLQGHRMKPYASEIARQLAGSLGGAGGGNITIEVVTQLDGREVARVTAPHIDTELERRKSQNNRGRGIT